MELYREYLQSFTGTLEVVANHRELLEINLIAKPSKSRPNHITHIGLKWLQSYFIAKPEPLFLPLKPASTPFLEDVRRAVMQIPFGECRSYKEIAISINRPRAYRAVAMAMKRNPYMIYVPCHRVVGSSGIGGYTPGIEIKRKLLEFERCESISL